MIFTSCFFHSHQFGGHPVIAISRGVPRGWEKVAVETRLAPTWPMLKMEQADYNVAMLRILNRLNPQQLYRQLDGKILLCWEPPDVFCHRRMVAEWFETELGVVVPEWGYDRSETVSWDEMETKEELKRKKIPTPYDRKVNYVAVFHDYDSGEDVEDDDTEEETYQMSLEF